MEILATAIFYLGSGLFGLALTVFARFKPLVFYYSVFSLAIGMWSLSVSPVRGMIHTGSWRGVELLSFYITPLGLALYFNNLFGGGHRNVLTRIAQYYAALIIISLSYVTLWSHSLESVLRIYEISLLIAIVLWMVMLLPTIRHNRENLSVIIGGSVMGITGIIDLLHAMKILEGPVQIIHFGILVFFLAISAQFIVSVLDLNRRQSLLTKIAAGTTGIGNDFFRSFVRELAAAFDARSAIIGKFVKPENREIETLAVWADGGIAENFRYDADEVTAGTPDTRFKTKNHFGIPLIDKNSEAIGMITVLHDRLPRKNEFNRTIMEIFAARASAEIQRKAAEEEIHYIAQHDALTNLPNRALFGDRLQQAIAFAEAHNASFALLFLDIDHFKKINDLLGNQRADTFLRKIGEILQQSVSTVDTVSRRGGDEFIILLPEDTKPEDAASLAQKIGEKVAERIEIDGFRVNATVSIGIAVFPRDGTTAEMLLKNADIAMYHAKASGRNQFQYFSDELNRITHERIELDSDLRDAIRKNELEVYYQPQLNFKNGKIESCEALLRWHHTVKGSIPPSKFIPIAEESGQIIEIGKWVLNSVAENFTTLENEGIADLRISVNASARQIQSNDFATSVEEIIARHALAPHRLELEVTESMIMQDTQKSRLAIKRLSEIGVKFSIDDFGTGYSSLSYLRQLKIHYLKIDQSFVRDVEDDPDDAAIVRTIIGLAHNLRLSVVAEGVETAEQQQFLKAHGCDIMQGYLLAKPMPFAELIIFLKNFRQT